jgi:hypothetical protein
MQVADAERRVGGGLAVGAENAAVASNGSAMRRARVLDSKGKNRSLAP